MLDGKLGSFRLVVIHWLRFYPFKSFYLQHRCHVPYVWCFSLVQLNCVRLVLTRAAWWMARGWAETISWAPPWPSTVIQAMSSRVIPVSPVSWAAQTDPNGTELCPAVKVISLSHLFCAGIKGGHVQLDQCNPNTSVPHYFWRSKF